MKIQKVKGTRDFYPEDMKLHNWILSKWKKVAEKLAYKEFDGPMLENAELWKVKSGDEIPEQMYTLNDKSGRLLAVRPELTPTLARMVAERQKVLKKPIKWFSSPRCWRYENPQSGRLREFWQFNMDALGSDSMSLDAEIILSSIMIMEEFDLDETYFYVRISNRKVIRSILKAIGVEENNLNKISSVIDKKDKLTENDFIEMLKEQKMTDKQVQILLKTLLIDNITNIDKLDIKLDTDGTDGINELKELMHLLELYGVGKYCKMDLSIMRGFDYYTSTIFEVFDKSNKFRAIAGGGRYDDLVSVFEGDRCPGVGYGMGDVVLELFLREHNKIPDLNDNIDFFIALIDDSVMDEAIKITQILRKKYNVEMELIGRKLGKQLSYTDAKKVIIVGKEDLEDNKITLKDMDTGDETKISINDIKDI
ncbi:MAG: histidine--tRNA ligase [DPANN group archaeon]|nr:histidine--tRNA ligase [DPANN group archaeon]